MTPTSCLAQQGLVPNQRTQHRIHRNQQDRRLLAAHLSFYLELSLYKFVALEAMFPQPFPDCNNSFFPTDKI